MQHGDGQDGPLFPSYYPKGAELVNLKKIDEEWQRIYGVPEEKTCFKPQVLRYQQSVPVRLNGFKISPSPPPHTSAIPPL